MTDPYRVLGVSPTATDDEIKAAYRKLAKQYHPDNFAGNPLGDKAEEKMKEINAAYEQIKDERSGKGRRSSYNAYSAPRYNASSRFAEIANLIQQNRLTEAETLLLRFADNDRPAEWHYYMGHVCYRTGRMDNARTEFATACNMDPTNPAFRNAYDSMNRGSSYSPYGSSFDSNCDQGDVCRGIMCANCLCNLMRCCY